MRSLNLILPAASLLLHSSSSLATIFEPVNLTPPLNWLAGPGLFPGNVIAGYNADLTEYDATSWGAHILEACAGFTACTSALAYQGTYYPERQDWFLGPADERRSDKQRRHGGKVLVWICV
jgi:hypothetical protein